MDIIILMASVAPFFIFGIILFRNRKHWTESKYSSAVGILLLVLVIILTVFSPFAPVENKTEISELKTFLFFMSILSFAIAKKEKDKEKET